MAIFWGQEGPASWSCLFVCSAQKSPFIHKISPKKSKSSIFLKILTFPNSLNLRASTDVKSGQNFQLEPGQNPIGT